MRKISLAVLGFCALVLLSACGNAQVEKPEAVRTNASVEQISEKKPDKKVEPVKEKVESEVEFDSSSSQECVEDFLEAYYSYDSFNGRVKASKTFCKPEVQKSLGLVESKNEMEMRSELVSAEVYQGDEDGEYLALVTYTVNNIPVTPQVLKLQVDFEGGKYSIGEATFPLMK
ncbi:MAG: EF0163 family protein [Lactococcus garvieae]